MRTARLLALVGLALLSGCATRPAGPAAPAGRPAGEGAALPAPEARVPDAATYVARAASYDQLVIRAGEVGLPDSDAMTDGLRRTLAEEHRGLAAQLSLAGRRLNLLPSPVLLANHQAWLDEFAAVPSRSNYLRLMRRVHQNSYAMHAGFAERGGSPTLRLVARNAAASERRHFALLR